MSIRYLPPAHSPIELSGVPTLLQDAPLERLETRLRDIFGRSGVTLTGSGTEALTLALRAILPRQGSRTVVALPAYGCFDIGTAAVGADVDIRFYDVDPETLAPEPESLANAVARGVDGVVVAPLYGLPVEWEAIRAVIGSADGEGPALIEDAAQGFGATWKGLPLGSFGDLSVLSFGRGKGWTGGGGGALIWNEGNPDVRWRAPDTAGADDRGGLSDRDARILASTGTQAVFSRPWLYGIPARLPFLRLGETVYKEPTEPSSMSRASAALAIASEPAARDEAKKRRETADGLRKRLEEAVGHRWNVGFRIPRSPEGGRPSYLRLPVLTPAGMQGFDSPSEARRLGIMPGYPLPLTQLAPLSELVLGSPPVPGSKELVRRIVTVPTHTLLHSRDLDSIGDAFAAYRD